MAYTWGVPNTTPTTDDEEEGVEVAPDSGQITLTSPSGQTFVVNNPGPFSSTGLGTAAVSSSTNTFPMPSGREGKYFMAPPYGVEMKTGLAGSGRIYYNPPEMWMGGGGGGGREDAWAPTRSWTSFRDRSAPSRSTSQPQSRVSQPQQRRRRQVR